MTNNIKLLKGCIDGSNVSIANGKIIARNVNSLAPSDGQVLFGYTKVKDELNNDKVEKFYLNLDVGLDQNQFRVPLAVDWQDMDNKPSNLLAWSYTANSKTAENDGGQLKFDLGKADDSGSNYTVIIPNASENSNGVMNTAAQSLKGIKTFIDGIQNLKALGTLKTEKISPLSGNTITIQSTDNSSGAVLSLSNKANSTDSFLISSAGNYLTLVGNNPNGNTAHTPLMIDSATKEIGTKGDETNLSYTYIGQFRTGDGLIRYNHTEETIEFVFS